MAEAERTREPSRESSDEVLFRDDPADSGLRASEGFRLHDSGEFDAGVALADDAFADAAPDDEGDVADDAPAHDDDAPAHDDARESGVALLDLSPDAGEDSGRFTAAPPPPRPRPRAPTPQRSKRAAEFYAAGVETHAPEPTPTTGSAPTGFAVCAACEAKNPADARSCGRCGEALPDAIPAGPRGPTAPGMAIKVLSTREAIGPGDDAVLPPHARALIQARRAEQADAQQASEARYHARRRGLMLRVGGVFALIGLLPSLLLVSGWLWWACLVVDLLIGAGVAKFLVDREAHTLSGATSFAVGSVAGTLLKGVAGAVLQGLGLLFLFGACFFSLVLAVVAGGFVGGALERSSLDEA